jgi:hypothetical protein
MSASACRSASNRATTCEGVHAWFNDLQGDLTTNGTRLIGEPNLAHPPFADALQ